MLAERRQVIDLSFNYGHNPSDAHQNFIVNANV